MAKSESVTADTLHPCIGRFLQLFLYVCEILLPLLFCCWGLSIWF